MATPASYGSLPFAEQNAFLQRKLPSVDYQRVRREAHDHAFVVAGGHRADLVADLLQVLQRVQREGGTLAAFREDAYAVFDHYGWEPEGGRRWRSRVIYETNLRTSYAAGRYAQLQAVKKSRPYWQYQHSDAVITPRQLHLEWDGLVLEADNPWWETHYPPNGWGCQCRVRALNARDLERLGKSGPDAPPAEQTRTVFYKGEEREVPVGIDPGWDYAPGRSAYEQQLQQTLSKTERLPAAPAAQMTDQLLEREAVRTALDADWRRWLDALAADMQPRNRQMVVGALSAPLVARLQEAAIVPATAAIRVTDKDVLHTVRDAKAGAVTAKGLPKALTMDELAALPQILAAPQAILLDASSSTLLYVFAAERREAGKVAVQVNFTGKGERRETLTYNSVRSASLIDWGDVRKDVLAGKLTLLEGTLEDAP